MNNFRNYDLLYPDLIASIINYFSASTGAAKKNVLSFCEKYTADNKLSDMIQPDTVNKICNILVDEGMMTCLNSGKGLGLDANYFCTGGKQITEKQQLVFNCLVYGFEYTYNYFKDNNIVIPLVWIKDNGDYSVGSGFRAFGGIVTAKHCLTEPKHLSIKGYTKAELDSFELLVHSNSDLDIAFIKTSKEEDNKVFYEDASVMEEVLVMGYPKIPTFTNFLTAEKALVSSKAESRITPSTGQVSAIGTQYLSKSELMLITAKIRGGNSGGPVINKRGSVVGVSCQAPNYKDAGDYDDLGYGIAVPIKYLIEILDGNSEILNVSPDFFMDYES